MAEFFGIDIGTSHIKVVVFDTDIGRVIHCISKPTPCHHFHSGWSEHDPDELWKCVCDCLITAANRFNPIAIGISSLAEAGVALDRNRHPIYPMIAWFDRRTEPQTQWIESHLSHEEIHRITGQLINPSFSLLKLKWLQDHIPDFKDNFDLWLSIPDFIHWKLTGAKPITDYSVASRTLLFDQQLKSWSPELLKLIDISTSQLPEIAPSGTISGYLSSDSAKLTGLPKGLPVVLGGHDHLCAAFACGATKPGIAVDSSGSSSSIIFLLNQFVSNQQIVNHGYACYHYLEPESFLLKAGLKSSGSAIQWLMQVANCLNVSNHKPDFKEFEAAAEKTIGKMAGPLWLPHLMGSGTPEGDRFSLGAVVGLSSSHTLPDLYRGLLESLGCWCRQNLEVMQLLTQHNIGKLILTGGVHSSNLICNIKANLLCTSVYRPQIPESAAVGAALIAAIGVGCLPGFHNAPDCLDYPIEQFDPDSQLETWYEDIYKKCYLSLYPALQNTHRVIQGMNANLLGRKN